MLITQLYAGSLIDPQIMRLIVKNNFKRSVDSGQSKIQNSKLKIIFYSSGFV